MITLNLLSIDHFVSVFRSVLHGPHLTRTQFLFDIFKISNICNIPKPTSLLYPFLPEAPICQVYWVVDDSTWPIFFLIKGCIKSTNNKSCNSLHATNQSDKSATPSIWLTDLLSVCYYKPCLVVMIAKWQKSTFQDHEQLHQDRHEVQPLVDNSDVQHQKCNLHQSKRYYSACRQCYRGFCEDCLHDQEIRVCDKADGLLIEIFFGL